MPLTFVHLDIHTEYSISDGLCRIDELMTYGADAGMGAITLSDKNNLFAAVKFFRAATKAGIKPILGAELWVQIDEQTCARVILLCRNLNGYRQLSELLSQAYQHSAHPTQPAVAFESLVSNTDGLIAISGGFQSDIGSALSEGHYEKALVYAKRWANVFKDAFYLMVSRIGREHEEPFIQQTVKMAHELQLPIVATNEVRFILTDDFIAHEARVAIHDGYTLEDPKRPRRYTPQQYLRSAEEMQTLFSDLPEALQNTVEIAKRCNLVLELGVNHLPNFPLPVGVTVEHYLLEEAQRGLQKRFEHMPENTGHNVYQARLQIELKVINAMGFAGYFLIVADFIQWAKNQRIPVGPGRGSGAGSLVAYVLGITDLDPLQYDLLFERFLNPERVSLPDFDIDFCMQRRDEVIDYVMQKYGRDKVAQIITFGTMAAKAVIRDVGRVQGYPYGFVDKIAKLIPFEIGMTLEKALVDAPQLNERYENEDEVKDLIDLALKLEGIARNAGKHAGGVVISPRALTDFVPLYCEPDGSNVVTQFDKDDVESIGLVKFDFLGLRTLTIIQWACDTINALPTTTTPIDINTIPLDDKATFKLLQQCQTTAVFQLESRGMKDLIKRLQPDCFEEIIALVALFRPGPLQSGMVDDFINRKHGRSRVSYFHASLEPVLRPTYGVILYQEQVMQIAQVLAGYTLGSADLLRRAMGKKKAEEMAEQREIFVSGATGCGVDESLATTIFDLMEKFAGYGFNKSHSAAYALLAYQTGWLKAHYPAAFMAAVLSSDMDNTDKVVNFIEDCRAMKVEMRMPDVNQSQYYFTVKDNAILFGLGAIKGAGEAAIESIVQVRAEGGPFKNLFDLCARVEGRKVNRRVLEAFVRAGALDSFGEERSTLLASLDSALKRAEQDTKNKMGGQFDLFSVEHETDADVPYVRVPAWPLPKQLDGEKATLGFYISGHPLDFAMSDLRQLIAHSINDLRAQSGTQQWMAGIIAAIRLVKTRQGKSLQIISLEDKSGKIDLVLFSDDVEKYQELIAKDNVIIVEGEVNQDNFSGGLRVRAKRIYSLSQARAVFAKTISIHIDSEKMNGDFSSQLSEWVKPYTPGTCPIDLHYHGENAKGVLRLAPAWCVNVNDELITVLKEKLGSEKIFVEYKKVC